MQLNCEVCNFVDFGNIFSHSEFVSQWRMEILVKKTFFSLKSGFQKRYSEGEEPTDRGLMDGPCAHGQPPFKRRFERRKWYGGKRYHLHRIRRSRSGADRMGMEVHT